MKAAVINLPQRTDRKETFLRWNSRQPLPFQFFTAVQGSSLDPAELARNGVLAPNETLFGAGSLGNALSHLSLWQLCAQGREPFLIFEDDACLRGDFWKHAKPILEKYISAHDAITFGFNTDAGMAIKSSDGVVSSIHFIETAKRSGDYFDEYAKLSDVRPGVFQCLQYWGTLAYAVSPQGARSLIRNCFPLSSKEPVRMIGAGQPIAPYGIDGMINVGLQKRTLDILACYPALATGPNSRIDSDIQARARV